MATLRIIGQDMPWDLVSNENSGNYPVTPVRPSFTNLKAAVEQIEGLNVSFFEIPTVTSPYYHQFIEEMEEISEEDDTVTLKRSDVPELYMYIKGEAFLMDTDVFQDSGTILGGYWLINEEMSVAEIKARLMQVLGWNYIEGEVDTPRGGTRPGSVFIPSEPNIDPPNNQGQDDDEDTGTEDSNKKNIGIGLGLAFLFAMTV